MSDLLDAVDALTKPTYNLVGQWYGRGCPTCTRTDEHMHNARIQNPPMLDQLRDAITDAMGSGKGSSGSLTSERNLIDADALHQFTIISTQIRDWCRMIGADVRKNPREDLRAWYAKRIAQNTEPTVDEFFARKLREWAAVIETKIDPPVTIELTFACPLCGADTWTDEDDTTYMHPVKVSYRRGDPDVLRTAQGLCRACGKVWKSTTELRELRWDADHIEQSAEAGCEAEGA